MAVYQDDSCIAGSQVEGRAEINLSADYDFDVMDIGSNT